MTIERTSGSQTPTLQFDRGTILVSGVLHNDATRVKPAEWDERTGQWRAPASAYRALVTNLRDSGQAYEDRAKTYRGLSLPLKEGIRPRKHQSEGLAKWRQQGHRGVVCLPTGAGKTILAVMAMHEVARPTIIVVPTIDLLHQWIQVLNRFFAQEIGQLGGGKQEPSSITVATYDSAAMRMESIGDQFGLLVCDECHHLPALQYRVIAQASLAPFRLGLSATVERADNKEELIFEDLGPLCYEGRIDQLQQNVLAPYRVECMRVSLTPEERRQYNEARRVYTSFLSRSGVSFDRPNGWQDFVIRSSRTAQGREAMQAYRRQKKLAQAATGKLNALWSILQNHRHDPTIVFTDDNEFAYRLGNHFLLPVVTHKTKAPERKSWLDQFRRGKIKTLVTSKVLNEGVDVPEASVGVVVSGSGAVREHVQRLGRILRHRPGKQAILYEIVAERTNETFVNQRRRQHYAYQRTPEVPR